jgi:hypothetical protein
MGSGANNTARYVGAAIGTSIVAVISTNGGASPAGAPLVEGWNNAVLYACVTCGLASVVSMACRARLTASERAGEHDPTRRRHPGP